MSATAPVVVIEPTAEKAAAVAAERVAAIVAERSAGAGEVHVALCGGTTPGELYRVLAAQSFVERLPCGRMHFFFGDERDVPQDSVESNYRLAAQTLLDHVPVAPGKVHPMPADCQDLDAAARQYETIIRRLVPADGGQVPRLDLILLGLGGDGHTASLFPDTPALDERERLVVAHFVPVIGRNRMTFTFPLINAARCVMFYVTGADKAKAVGEILGGDEQARSRHPAGHVRPWDGQLIFVLDEAASRAVATG